VRRSLSIRITGVTCAVFFAAFLTAGALAYFSTSGVGSAAAGVKTFSAPTISAATPGASSVALSWSAVTPPGPGTVTYSVSRDGEDAGGNCPDISPPQTVTSCTDGNVPIGTHTYTVTARWRSWSASSAPSSAKVTVVAVVSLELEAATETVAAGAADNLTITAEDASGNPVITYIGSHNLTFSGASNSPIGTAPTVANSSGTATKFGTATAITFTKGVASVTSSTKNGLMKLYKAGTTSIAVSDGAVSNSTPVVVTVTPGPATKLSLAAATTTPVAGVEDNLATTALDAYGNIATSYTGSHNLTFSGAAASPNGTVPTITNSAGVATGFATAMPIEFSAGVATVSGSGNGVMELYKPVSTSITVTDGAISAPALVFTVAAAPAARFTLGAASLKPAAAATDNLTTTAFDEYGNTATSYVGAHNLTFSGASSSPSGTPPSVIDSAGSTISFGAPTAINFTNGIATVSASKNGVMKLYKAETAVLSVSDGSISTTATLAVTVATTTATRFAFTNVVVSGGALSSPCLFTCTVTDLGNSGTFSANIGVTDAYGNLLTALGSGHSATVTASGGTVTGGALTIATAGPAESATRFTYTSKSAGTFSDKITAAKSAGTAYTSAIAETSR
jgi:hypothetical protein